MSNNEESFTAFDRLLVEISRFPESASSDNFLPDSQTTSYRSNISKEPSSCSGNNTDDSAKLHNDRICMIGLHSCADLTPVMLRYFIRYVHTVSVWFFSLQSSALRYFVFKCFSMSLLICFDGALYFHCRHNRLKSLICIGCCYHKLSQTGAILRACAHLVSFGI